MRRSSLYLALVRLVTSHSPIRVSVMRPGPHRWTFRPARSPLHRACGINCEDAHLGARRREVKFSVACPLLLRPAAAEPAGRKNARGAAVVAHGLEATVVDVLKFLPFQSRVANTLRSLEMRPQVRAVNALAYKLFRRLWRFVLSLRSTGGEQHDGSNANQQTHK